jgi:hypothetical protein
VSARRAAWLREWGAHARDKGTLTKEELAEVLGRWSFVGRILEDLKPFLGPLYSWMSTMPGGARRRIPAMLHLVLEFLEQALKEDSTVPASRENGEEDEPEEAFRTDARADDESAEIGGWDCSEGKGTKEAAWFHLYLDRENAPWVFDKTSPKRIIAALELFASLVALKVLVPEMKSKGGTRRTVSKKILRVSGGTDNKGNGHLVDKYMTTTYPLNCVLMEVSKECRSSMSSLGLRWRCRDENTEADAITNGDFSLFDATKKVEVSMESLGLDLMNSMLARGLELYHLVKEAKDLRREAHQAAWKGGRKKKGRKLRLRAPWDEEFPGSTEEEGDLNDA